MRMLFVFICVGLAAAFAPSAGPGLRTTTNKLQARHVRRTVPASTPVQMQLFGGIFGGGKPASAPVGNIALVPGGWVNPEFMRGFTFDTVAPGFLPSVGSATMAGVKSGGAPASLPKATGLSLNVFGADKLANANAAPAKENQDGVLIIPELVDGVQMYCVFDGHGENGGQVTRWSEVNLPAYMAQAVQAGRTGELLNRITDAYRAADGALETALSYKAIEDSGTTVATALVKGDLLLVAGLGDSRVVLGSVNSQDGTLSAQPLTRDQSPVVPAERARIDKSGGEVREEGPGGRVYAKGKSYPGLAVARALGDGDGKNYGVTADPQFIGWKLRVGQDFVLILASDGVWNALGNENVVEIVAPFRTTRDATAAANAVVGAARKAWEDYAKGRIDDISAVVLFLDQ